MSVNLQIYGHPLLYSSNSIYFVYHFPVVKELCLYIADFASTFYQEMRMGGLPHQNASPGLSGGLNPVPGPALNGICSNSSGGPPFPNIAMTRPPSIASGYADAINNLSAVEVYYQKHEITATVRIVTSQILQLCKCEYSAYHL